MDLRMPVMDGYEALTHIRHIPEIQAIPIIALTATAMAHDEAAIRAHGFDGYLRKPVTRHEVLHTLSEYLPSSHKPSSAVSRNALTPPGQEETSGIANGAWYAELEQMLQEWQTVLDSGSFQAVEDFGTHLRTLGEKYRCEQIQKFSEKLLASVAQFDVEFIQGILQTYPQILESLKFEQFSKTC